MLEKLFDLVKEKWLTPISAAVLLPLLAGGYVSIVSAVNDWDGVTLNSDLRRDLAIPFAVVWLIYVIMCMFHARLPKAPHNTWSVLFCIDAESKQLFDAAEYKLVHNFSESISDDEGNRFKALCISQARLRGYDLQEKEDALKVLERTNCVLLVRVRYTADDINNAENFELTINYGVRHPAFDEMARSILSYDMSALRASVGKQNFRKAETIDVFNTTTQTLVCSFQYILGFVALLANENRVAMNLLTLARNATAAKLVYTPHATLLLKLIDDRLYAATASVAVDAMKEFQKTRDLRYLRTMRDLLERSNQIHPDTFFYNLNMAYAYIILDADAGSARKCLEKCKRSKQDKSWLYSDAFLSAYLEHAPGVVISKYNKAFKNPYKSLVEIVEYIEYIIDRDPKKITLHLAAALVYEEMGDSRLMKYHYSRFLDGKGNLDQRTKTMIEEKLKKKCSENCDSNCSHCAEQASA